ncbi:MULTISPECIES: hypothetical protein [unclassified Stenotrophomonas]|uniref:hypothetical protein n=1 Tax=unclassified Stenotrophomonas TaxID=196198 RepID=UPI00211912EB|nr:MULTISPECIES: hypothetical protein [unclassified Stenotrophomonas]
MRAKVLGRGASLMVEYPHPLQSRGRYQLVALTNSPVYSPADVFGFAVLTSEGARITEVVSLDDAHSQWERLLAKDEAVSVEDEIVEKRTTSRKRRR